MATGDALYDNSAAMEPLLPEVGRPRMAELTCEILRKGGELTGRVSAQINQERIAALVREMNSYYSNLIEGHKTLPREIEAAMSKAGSTDNSISKNQELARAHIKTEEAMRQRLAQEAERESQEKGYRFSIHSAEFLCWLHRNFYAQLPEDLQQAKSEGGAIYQIVPGALRNFEVSVGQHQPPHWETLPKLLAYLERRYGSQQILDTNQLVALAAAHHRLAWVHPFGDGNGRVIRLYSHACLIRSRADSKGLWNISRGLARWKTDYYQLLSAADKQRLNDYDGRGNLTDKGLADFCIFFLEKMLDQIGFMGDLLQLQTLATRIERYLQLELLHLRVTERERLGRLLKAALYEGLIERGRVREITNTGDTVAREIINLALREKLLDSPRGGNTALALVFSAQTLETYFPRLYQDLPVDGEA